MDKTKYPNSNADWHRQRNRITNTTVAVARNPMGFIVESMVGGVGSAIEAQERTGQNQFVKSETLPTRLGLGLDERAQAKASLEAAGFKFLGEVEGDSLFQYVEFPAGWQKRRTDHSMWSELVDDKGRVRGSIFYKAAFYDRDAHMSLNRRYRFEEDYEARKAGKYTAKVIDTATGTTIHEIDPITPTDKARGFEASDAVRASAKAWLQEHFPQWEDAGAYWD